MKKASGILESIMDNLLQRNKTKKYNTGLVLSGGAARGFAHLGAIKALHEHDIKPDIVSGVSAGAIVGSFYADGYHPEEILEIFRDKKIFKLIKLAFNKQGLFKITGMKKVLSRNLRAKNIEDLKIPLVITATAIDKGITSYFVKGNLVDAVMASSSIPVLFRPVKIDGNYYVDGGVTNNFPVEPLVDICKDLIGVHVNPISGLNMQGGLGHIGLQSFHVSIASGLEKKREKLKYFIEPDDVKDYTHYAIDKAAEIMDIGYKKANEVLNA